MTDVIYLLIVDLTEIHKPVSSERVSAYVDSLEYNYIQFTMVTKIKFPSHSCDTISSVCPWPY